MEIEYDTTRVFMRSSARVTVATYWSKFSMKSDSDEDSYRPFLFREKKYAKDAYAALCEQLPAYVD